MPLHPSRPRIAGAAAAVAITAGVAVTAGAGSGGDRPATAGPPRPAATASHGATRPEVIRLKDARLKFEINATDRDGGVQVFIDADGWRRMSLLDPAGRRILHTVTSGRMARQGGTELFLESAEPSFGDLPLRRLLKRFPEGRYAVRGTGLAGSATWGRRASATRSRPGPCWCRRSAARRRRTRTAPPSSGSGSPRRRGAASSATRCSSCAPTPARRRCPRSPST